MDWYDRLHHGKRGATNNMMIKFTFMNKVYIVAALPGYGVQWHSLQEFLSLAGGEPTTLRSALWPRRAKASSGQGGV